MVKHITQKCRYCGIPFLFRKNLFALLTLLLAMLSQSLYAVTYSVSPTGWTSKPSSSISYNGVTYIDATTQGIYISARAVVNSNNTVTFYVKKSSGSFQNTTQFRLIKDINGSNQKAVGQTYAYSGDSEASLTITPDFSSGSYQYTFIVISNGSTITRFCTRPITISAYSGSPNLSLASSQSFGTTTLTAGTTYTYTVKVKNTGTADWEGHLYLKAGNNDWISFYDRTISAGSTVTLTKTYTPTTTGTYSLTLYYQTDGSGDGVKVPAGSYSNPFSITVVGASPSLSLASSQSFGTTTLTAGTTYTYTVKVKNTGTGDWNGHLHLKAGNNDWISFYDRTISAGSTVTLTKTYTPTTTGTYSLTLYYQTGGSGDGVKVPAGSYSNPFSVTVVSGSPSLSLASSQSFGTTTLTAGTTYTYTVKVKNSGTGNWYGHLHLKAGNNDWISFYERTISAGSTVTLTKTYTPTTTGTYSLTLYYQTDGSGDGVKVPAGSYSNPFSVTVVGASPSLSLASSQSFGTTTLTVGTEYTYSVKVKNSGTSNWYGHLHLKSGNNDWIHLYERTISAGSTVTLTKTYTPTTAGTHTLTLYYQTNGTGDGVKVPAGSYSNPFTVTVVSGTNPTGDCSFSDVPTSNAFYSSTCYLYKLNVLSGSDVDGKMKVEEKLTRAHLAKIAFRGVYSIKSRQVPTSVPSDNYPTIYSDLTDKSTYYYQAARALLYLEYGDGITPFDRDQTQFNPSKYIKRMHVVKVLLETFNIKPDLAGTNNPYPSDADMVTLASNNPLMMGYMRKANSLGIITAGRPYDDCLRGEAFAMLARIMQKVDAGNITDPNPATADYFQPLNITLNTISMGLSLPLGNFQHYTKTSFALSGTVPLTFGHTYNSYNTTLPEVFYGMNDYGETYQPLGDGWSHNYHTFISIPGGLNGSDTRLLVHWGGGSMDVYKPSGSTFVPVSYGVYDELSLVGSEVVIKTKSQMEYHFSSQGSSGLILYLSSVKDRNGNTLTLTYQSGVNGMKRIKSVSDGNRTLTFSYKSGTNLVSSVSDPLGRSIKFSYSLNSNTQRYQLKTFTDAKGQVTRYTYGDDTKLSTSKLLEKIQLPKGNYIENDYDAKRRLSKTVSGVNGVPTTETDVTVTASYGSSTSTKSKVVVNRGSQSSTYNYTYNANNAMTKLTGNQSLSVTNTYGSSSHPELPTAIKTNNTNVSNITYDAKGNITKLTVTGDGTLTTTMTYDDMNNLTSVTDPKGYKTTYTYDSKGNLTGISEPESVTTSITVNSKGQPTEVTNPMGVKTQFQYNSYGNVTKTTFPALSLSTTTTYDNASRITSATDALSRTTSFAYDNNDNLTSMTDPASHTTSFEFDKNDNMTSITNAKGGVTSMSYDNATDWLTSVSFAGSTKQFEYNDDGSVDTYTKPDGTTLSYSYDNLGRITNDGVNSYSYDSQLRLSSITGGGKTLSFTYDGFNRITGTSFDGHSNSYTYDKNGNCTSVNNTTYAYDKLNRITSVTFSGKTISYTYRKDSQLSKVTYPNGMTTTFGYDAVGRLTSKSTKLSNGTVVAGYSYTLDKVGNITKQTTTEPYGDISLTNEETSYTYNSGNRITKAGSISFTFDANGNTTKRGSEAYSWDALDRMTKTGSTSIKYDPFGLITSYGSTTFTTDPLGMGNVLSDSKSGAEYIYGVGLEARVKSGKVSYYVTDVRGSVVAIVDDNGNITHKYQYDEFGNVVQKQETDYNPFQFVGKHGVMVLNDHQYYMRARHYDPTIGRFLSEDPIWSTNLYPYADNNPIMGIDPRGLFSESIDKFSEVLKMSDKVATTSSAVKNAGNVVKVVSDGGKAAEKTAMAYKALHSANDAVTEIEKAEAVSNLNKSLNLKSLAPVHTIIGGLQTLATGDGNYTTIGMARDAGSVVTKAGLKVTKVGGPAGMVVSIVSDEVVTATTIAKMSSSTTEFWNNMDKYGPTGYKLGQYVGNKLDNMWDAVLGPMVK